MIAAIINSTSSSPYARKSSATRALVAAAVPAAAEHIDIEFPDPLDVAHSKDDMIDRLDGDHRSSAATPGSVRPSIHSRNAPPAVEM